MVDVNAPIEEPASVVVVFVIVVVLFAGKVISADRSHLMTLPTTPVNVISAGVEPVQIV